MGSALSLEPTFPLDEHEISRQTRLAMLRELVPWGVAGILTSVAFSFMLGKIAILLGMAATAYWIRQQFRKIFPKIEARVISALIRENNRSQNRQLEEVVTGLRRQGLYAYASALGKFILLKQRIETNLHQSGSPSFSNQQLDNLVDRICSLTCDHLSKLSDLDSQVGAALTTRNEETLKRLVNERMQVLTHIQRAYCMMYECMDTLRHYKASTHATADYLSDTVTPSQTAMDLAIHQLEQENLLLKRIMQRVQTDLDLPPAPNQQFGASDGLNKLREQSAPPPIETTERE